MILDGTVHSVECVYVFQFYFNSKIDCNVRQEEKFRYCFDVIFDILGKFFFLWSIKWDEPRIHRSSLSNARVVLHTFRLAFELFAIIDHDNNVLLSSENIYSCLYDVSQLMMIVILMKNERTFRDHVDQIREFFSRVHSVLKGWICWSISSWVFR